MVNHFLHNVGFALAIMAKDGDDSVLVRLTLLQVEQLQNLVDVLVATDQLNIWRPRIKRHGLLLVEVQQPALVRSQIQGLAFAISVPILEQVVVELLASFLVFVVVFVILSNQYDFVDLGKKVRILKLFEMVDSLMESIADAHIAFFLVALSEQQAEEVLDEAELHPFLDGLPSFDANHVLHAKFVELPASALRVA